MKTKIETKLNAIKQLQIETQRKLSVANKTIYNQMDALKILEEEYENLKTDFVKKTNSFDKLSLEVNELKEIIVKLNKTIYRYYAKTKNNVG